MKKYMPFIKRWTMFILFMLFIFSFPFRQYLKDQQPTKVWRQEEIQDNEIISLYSVEGYNKAIDLVYEYYDKDFDKTIEWKSKLREMEKEKERKIVTITNERLNRDGNYFYYYGKINNNSNKTVKYIKYDIFMYNSEGQIIQTDWSCWSGTLPSGGSTSIDTIIDAVSGVKTYKTVIDEISYR